MRILHVIQEIRTGGAERVVALARPGRDAQRGTRSSSPRAPGADRRELGLSRSRSRCWSGGRRGFRRRPGRAPCDRRASGRTSSTPTTRRWRSRRARDRPRPEAGRASSASTASRRTTTGRGQARCGCRPPRRRLRARGRGRARGARASSAETIANAVPRRRRPATARARARVGLPAGATRGRRRPARPVRRTTRSRSEAIADVPGAALAIVGEGRCCGTSSSGWRRSSGSPTASCFLGLRERRPGAHGRGRRRRAAVALGGPAARGAGGARRAARRSSRRPSAACASSSRTSDDSAARSRRRPDALAAALRRVLDDAELAARLAAREPSSRRRSTESEMVRRFLELYESCWPR